ncbi:MAG: hypothetical protein A2252_08350 [Elusimicrobia bacterium RIFOXYA2_FULL_39_19]|nr:MAG: hypothetical protein A2252_08350 [Elusimicrobia bacterium RIFOXYA2_FULL_39_19]
MPDYSLLLCDKCHLIFTDPMKGPGSEFYESDFLPYKIGRILDNQQIRWPQRIFLNTGTPGKGDLLDVGCNTGLFLTEALKSGYNVTGIDFDHNAISIAKQNPLLKEIYLSTLDNFIPKTNIKYDIVTLFDVLEHLDDVKVIFKQLKTILKPGGYLVLSIPNRDRGIDIFNELDLPPHHLTHWNAKVLTSFLVNKGFNIINIDNIIKYDDLALYISNKTSIGLVKNKIGNNKTDNLSTNTIKMLKILSKLKNILSFLLGRLLYLPLLIFKTQSPTIYVLAQLKK